MSDTPKTRKFTAMRKFGHPDGGGTVEVGSPVDLTSTQAKKLNKSGSIGVFIEDDESEGE